MTGGPALSAGDARARARVVAERGGVREWAVREEKCGPSTGLGVLRKQAERGVGGNRMWRLWVEAKTCAGPRGRGFAGLAKEKGGADWAGLLVRERGLRVGLANWLLGCLG